MTASTLPARVDALEKAQACDTEKLGTVILWVNGNGTPGAKTRLALLEDSVKRIEARLDAQTKAITGAGISIGIAAVVYIATNLIPTIIGHIGP